MRWPYIIDWIFDFMWSALIGQVMFLGFLKVFFCLGALRFSIGKFCLRDKLYFDRIS